MALPAGRRGLRANLVRSDGTLIGFSEMAENLTEVNEDLTNIRDELNNLNAKDISADGIGYKYVEGNPCVITDGIAEEADNIIVKFGPVQSGSGDPSLTNIRPINGRTEITVTRSDGAETDHDTDTASVSFGQTVYGGTVDVTTGKLR